MSVQPGFDEFVRSNLDGLVWTAYLIAWDLTEAEDLVQDCLFKVAGRWDRVGAMEEPLAYTRRVLVNHAVRQSGRRSRRRAELQAPAPEFGADEPVLAGFAARQELMEAMGLLPPRQRAVIVLRYFLDMSEVDTARALGCSLGTVKSNAAKAISRLREAYITPPPLTEAYEP
jgi:RNA polymerase sigma-70 factor (sigma-E family)